MFDELGSYLLNGVTALNGTGAAAGISASNAHGGGDRKDREGKGGNNGEPGEHLGCCVGACGGL